MAKKKSWLSKLKRYFISETHPKPEKEKKKRWLMQRLKISRLPSLGPPPPLLLQDSTKGEAEDQRRKHDFTVAVAAHVASNVSAEVVQITDIAASVICKCEDDTQELPAIIHLGAHQSVRPYGREIQELAAIKIQTAFRGHLARKALRALKGLVKLQAIIRGRAVRRQAMSTLKCLQTMVSIQSQVCARRSQNFEETCSCHDLKDKVMKIESANLRRWDDSILTKEEANALFISKKEAALKRERIREYALSNRKSADHEQNKSNGKLRIWLEQWVDTQLAKREDLEDITSVFSSNTRIKDYPRNDKQLNYQKQYGLDGLVSPVSFSRTPFHQKKQQSSNADNETFPTYMAATESAKAKTRSTSSPKARQKSFDTYSEGNSPFKKLSVMSCVNSEVSSSGRMGKFDSLTYRSPSLKRIIPGPVKSGRELKDLSLDSDCSLLNWDRYGPFR